METKMKRLFKLSLLAIFVLAIVAGCNKDEAVELDVKSSPELELKNGHAAQNQLLAQVRGATAKYQRVEVAIADGYLEASHCVYNDELGAGMGYHFVNQGLVDPVFDPLQPEALLFEKGKNGKFKLVGVEYIVIDVGQPHPYFGNHPFDVGGTPVPVDHYSLHVWIWKHNPLGMFFPYNSNVSCDFEEL